MIPDEIKKRIPLIKEEHLKLLNEINEHQSSPIWNYTCGDRINELDLKLINEFQKKLFQREKRNISISKEILDWVKKIIPEVVLFQKNASNLKLDTEFEKIKFTNREDISLRLHEIVPHSISLERLIVNTTSGTTGHPISIPNRPDSIGMYSPLLIFALNKNGIFPEFKNDSLTCILICSQESTAVYSTINPSLNGTGFAKINLNVNSWRNKEDSKKFLEFYQPEILTGDPISFYELLKMDINIQPKCIVSTALEMNSKLAFELEKKFNTKLIDFFSANDTGPLFYKCKEKHFHLLPTDIHLEIIGEDGKFLDENQFGEITLTGGRNPFLPMLRYKTNDFGSIDFNECECGDKMPRVKNLITRKPVLFFNESDDLVNPIDLTQIMMKNPILQYQFHQNSNKNCILKLKPFHVLSEIELHKIKTEIEVLFKNKINLNISQNLKTVDGKKIISYTSDLYEFK